MDDPDARKLPSEDFIKEAIRKIMEERVKVDTQEKLCYLVLKELKNYDPSFVLSPRRVKNIALEIPEIEVKVKTKRMPKMEKVDKCPVCGSKVKPFYGKNLVNEDVLLGYRCVKCGYVSDLDSFVPMKYEFLWKPKVEELKE